MMRFEGDLRDKLIEAYKAFHAKAMDLGKESALSEEEAEAIGIKVMEDLIAEVCQRENMTEEERKEVSEEIKMIIIEEFPENLLKTSLNS